MRLTSDEEAMLVRSQQPAEIAANIARRVRPLLG